MSKPVPYLYSVLRLVPDIERGECLNVGLVVFSRPQRFLKVRYLADRDRLDSFASGINVNMIARHLETYVQIAAADTTGGPVAELDIGERFHWLTNISNTIIQPGPVHTGLTTDAEDTFQKLFTRLITPKTK